MMVLLIDNYDSFSYNLYQFVGTVNPDIRVIRNDEMTVEEIEALSPSHIILSPGPGTPENAGICIETARTVSQRIPTLGVCLGHQAICTAYGAVVTYAKRLMHGKQSEIEVDNTSKLFAGLTGTIKAARYHSLAALPETIPDCLKETGRTGEGEIMAVEHREYPIYGVQFHPESILTPDGMKIIENFLRVQ